MQNLDSSRITGFPQKWPLTWRPNPYRNDTKRRHSRMFQAGIYHYKILIYDTCISLFSNSLPTDLSKQDK